MMSEREADEMATHGEVLRWSPELHYVTTGLPCCCLFSFYSGVLLNRTFLPPDDEAKSQDVEERKSEDVEKSNTATQTKSVHDEADNTAIAVSLPAASNEKSRALGGRKPKRQLWEYEPVVDSASKYWGVEVEGKRTRTLHKASYAEEDARSDSEDDPEDAFNPQRKEESSSEVTMNLLQSNWSVSPPTQFLHKLTPPIL